MERLRAAREEQALTTSFWEGVAGAWRLVLMGCCSGRVGAVLRTSAMAAWHLGQDLSVAVEAAVQPPQLGLLSALSQGSLIQLTPCAEVEAVVLLPLGACAK